MKKESMRWEKIVGNGGCENGQCLDMIFVLLM